MLQHISECESKRNQPGRTVSLAFVEVPGPESPGQGLDLEAGTPAEAFVSIFGIWVVFGNMIVLASEYGYGLDSASGNRKATG
jgi:hypothetical protein